MAHFGFGLVWIGLVGVVDIVAAGSGEGVGEVVVSSSAGSDLKSLLLAFKMHSSRIDMQMIFVKHFSSQPSRSFSSKSKFMPGWGEASGSTPSFSLATRDLYNWGEALPIFSGSPPPPLPLDTLGFLICTVFLDPPAGILFHLQLSSGMFFKFSILVIIFLKNYLNFSSVFIGLYP